jgi:hypothetical protein
METGAVAEYDAKQDSTAPIPALPQIVGYCVIALTGIAFGCLILNALITRPYWNPRIEIVSDVLDALAANRTEINIAFVGSSRLNSEVDPLDFDARNNEAGMATTSFVLWIPDTAVGDLDFMLETLANTELPQLDYVVIEPRLLPLPASASTFRGLASSGNSARLRYIYNLERTGELFSRVISANPLTPSDAKTLTLLTLMGMANISNLGVLPDLLLPFPENKAQDIRIARHRGHMPSKPSSMRKFVLAGPEVDVREYSSASRFQTKSLETLIDRIESMGAKPVIFMPPVRSGIGTEKALRDMVAANFPGIPVLDYTGLAARGEILQDDENWIDDIHLSLEGSQRFAEQLSKDWLDE